MKKHADLLDTDLSDKELAALEELLGGDVEEVEEVGSRDKADLFRNPDFVLSLISGSFVAKVRSTMEEMKISQSDLARLMGQPRQRVSRILNETSNLTLRTVAEITAALGQRAEIAMYEKGEVVSICPARRPMIITMASFAHSAPEQQPVPDSHEYFPLKKKAEKPGPVNDGSPVAA